MHLSLFLLVGKRIQLPHAPALRAGAAVADLHTPLWQAVASNQKPNKPFLTEVAFADCHSNQKSDWHTRKETIEEIAVRKGPRPAAHTYNASTQEGCRRTRRWRLVWAVTRLYGRKGRREEERKKWKDGGRRGREEGRSAVVWIDMAPTDSCVWVFSP